ncbi:MAG: uroporphyrinogen-III C-methyltransferase [Chloroflexota bacterium]|nr:uroporphyrinogen-III C-methyltransferase [Chloroflexota bacterium]MDE2886347.1 uroporphyrinogen-III C-methyltransferase [Chloroflexota bacterium]
MTASGTVYLVGAGPGDPGLITARGADLLRGADVVVYDRLVSSELLALAPGADLIYVGKEPDTPGEFQAFINEQLAANARDGKSVVRLKGGDPFVFGRGGEEAIALAEAGVPFEVVPGVTSAIAVPAYAGVPVTHRDVAAAFTVVTGSEDPVKPDPQVDWKALARVGGTLVVLMGWRSLPAIVQTLLEEGTPRDTPVCVVQWGTLPNQRTVSGTLEDIVERGEAEGITSPVVTVIGETAALRPALRWFDRTPLFGRRVLVTRSRTQAGTLSALLTAHGAEAVELPTIAVEPVSDTSMLDAALAELAGFDWVVFTSTNGVDAVFGRLSAAGKDARAFAHAKVAAIGPATAHALAGRGITADLLPAAYTSRSVANSFASLDIRGARILLPRADIAPPTLPDGLRHMGALVTEISAYHTAVPEEAAATASETLASGTIDAVTFTSSSTVRNLVGLLGGADLINQSKVVSIGPVTSKTASELGVRVDREASEHTVRGVADAVLEVLGDE